MDLISPRDIMFACIVLFACVVIFICLDALRRRRKSIKEQEERLTRIAKEYLDGG